MQRKRGQMFSTNLLIYAILAIIIILISAVGIKFLSDFKEKKCMAEIQLMKNDLPLAVGEVERRFGSIEERLYDKLCGVDEVYFVDLNRIDPDVLLDVPEIENSLASFSDHNVFLMGGNDLVYSFHTGKLKIPFPHYNCLIPAGKRLGLFVEGVGGGADIINKYNFTGCSPVTIAPTQAEVSSMTGDIAGKENKNATRYEEKYNNTSIQNPFCHQTGNGFKIKIGKYKGYANLSVYHTVPDCLSGSIAIDTITSNAQSTPVPGSRAYNGDLKITKWHFNDVDSNGMIMIHYRNLVDINDICNGNICANITIIAIENATCQVNSDCGLGHVCQPAGDCS